MAGVAFGATYTVTDLADSGPGTLRDATGLANANIWPDTVIFDTLAFLGSGYTPIYRATQGGESVEDNLAECLSRAYAWAWYTWGHKIQENIIGPTIRACLF